MHSRKLSLYGKHVSVHSSCRLVLRQVQYLVTRCCHLVTFSHSLRFLSIRDRKQAREITYRPYAPDAISMNGLATSESSGDGASEADVAEVPAIYAPSVPPGSLAAFRTSPLSLDITQAYLQIPLHNPLPTIVDPDEGIDGAASDGSVLLLNSDEEIDDASSDGSMPELIWMRPAGYDSGTEFEAWLEANSPVADNPYPVGMLMPLLGNGYVLDSTAGYTHALVRTTGNANAPVKLVLVAANMVEERSGGRTL